MWIIVSYIQKNMTFGQNFVVFVIKPSTLAIYGANPVDLCHFTVMKCNQNS